MLTPKQEKFVRNLVKGMSQREAYKRSYNAENMNDKTIDEEASRLYNRPDISARYKELIERAANTSIMSAQERLEYLTRIVYGEEQEQTTAIVEGEEVIKEYPADLSTRLKAVEIMNKMTGEYVTKVEGNVNVTRLEDLL